MIPFLVIFSSIYFTAHLYFYLRLRPALPRGKGVRPAAAAVLIFFLAVFFLAGLGKRALPLWLSGELWRAGSWWFGFLFYAVLILLLIDLARVLVWLSRRLLGLPKRSISPARRRNILLAAGAAVLLLLIAGCFNARNPRVVSRRLELGPSCGPRESLDLVVISDLHLGVMVNCSFLRKLTAAVDALQPDLIVLIGDIVDRDIRLLERDKIGDLLSRLRAPLGVYAVTGNHEFITGVEEAVEYLSRLGIVFLRDRAVRIDDSFYLAGREDVTARRRGAGELPLEKVLSGIDPRCPVILLDHQPRRVAEAVAAGVDLLLCGHTHHGQLFPINLITSALYPVSWGYGVMERTQIYVTSGAGTWGPPVRIGNTPEIVQLRIEFKSRSR